MGILSSCICNTLGSVCAMKGIPMGPLAQWGKDFTYYLAPFFCLVNWDMYYPGSAYRGTDLPPGRILYTHTHTYIYIYIHICILVTKGEWDFRISDLVKNPDGGDIDFLWISVKSGRPSLPNPLSSPLCWSPWNLFRSFKVCSYRSNKERVRCGKQRQATAPIHL